METQRVTDRVVEATGEAGAQETAVRQRWHAATVLQIEFHDSSSDDDAVDCLRHRDGEKLVRLAIVDAKPWEL